MFERFREDVRTAYQTDPAAKSKTETLLYVGLWAVWAYRLAHRFYNDGHRLTARALSEFACFLTGVEIHPAAELGRRVFIDHGTGVVVGETAEIGDDVNMYHGVTLGGSDPRPVKRHPTVEDEATLGAASTLVGDITIGEGATVGAGAVVTDDVPPGVTVAGNPATPIEDGGDASAESESKLQEETADETAATQESDVAHVPITAAVGTGESDETESGDPGRVDGDSPSVCCQ